jgi:hypothetical protein
MHKQQFRDSYLACLKGVDSNQLHLFIQLITVTVTNKGNAKNHADPFRVLLIYFYSLKIKEKGLSKEVTLH